MKTNKVILSAEEYWNTKLKTTRTLKAGSVWARCSTPRKFLYAFTQEDAEKVCSLGICAKDSATGTLGEGIFAGSLALGNINIQGPNQRIALFETHGQEYLHCVYSAEDTSEVGQVFFEDTIPSEDIQRIYTFANYRRWIKNISIDFADFIYFAGLGFGTPEDLLWLRSSYSPRQELFDYLWSKQQEGKPACRVRERVS